MTRCPQSQGVRPLKVVIVTAALALFAAPAIADPQWSATPAKTVTKDDVIAGGVSWNCRAEGCRSSSDTSNADEMWTCRELARQVGELTDFHGSGRPYDAKRLASCNGEASGSRH